METTHKLEIDPCPLVQSYASLLFSWHEGYLATALRDDETIVVGRAEPADFVICHPSLSRVHARLSMHAGAVLLEDLGATNGCVINGIRSTGARLGQNDVAMLGAVEVRVCAVPQAAPNRTSVSHAAFMNAVRYELTRARLFGRSASVLALKEPHPEGGPIGSALQQAITAVDRHCHYAPGLHLVLLAEKDGESAARWLDGVNAVDRAGLRIGIASYPSTIAGPEELVSLALDICHAATPGTRPLGAPREGHAGHETVILSPCMLRLYDLAARVARTSLPVLVRGETGSGKELVARSIHERSPRAKMAFKALNCATIPASLVESTLFGHERGSFSGAERQAKGIFEQAHRGTIFLDEVGELGPQVQAALLRALEQRQIVRVGGTSEIDIDVRVVAATHRDLGAMVQAGTFREDLMFRLDALTLSVPPLRERAEEIVPLALLFLRRAKHQWGAVAERFSNDVLDCLKAYAWPGNIRQLKNVVERAAVLCLGAVIESEHLPHQLWRSTGRTDNAAAGPNVQDDSVRSLSDQVREFELSLIRTALVRAQGNQAKAARMLGIPRRTLANKVHAYGLV